MNDYVTSAQGIDLLARREGRRNHAYLDSEGIPTIGIGHTGPEVYLGLYWDDAKVDAVFAEDLAKYERAVNESVTVPLQSYEFDSLVSFTYNVGIGGEEHSTLVRELNTGDRSDIPNQFDRWHIPPDIISRRNAEREQFKGTAFEPEIP